MFSEKLQEVKSMTTKKKYLMTKVITLLVIFSFESFATSGESADLNIFNKTPLSTAVESNDKEAVKFLLKQKNKIDLNMRDKEGETVLMKAIKNRHFEIAELLIDAGAKIHFNNKKEKKLRRALENAVDIINFDIVKNLLSSGVNIENKFGEKLLLRAIDRVGELRILKKVLDISPKSDFNVHAVIGGEIISFDENTKNNLEQKLESSKKVMDYLLRSGVKVDVGHKGILSKVVSTGRKDLVETVLSAGVNIRKYGNSVPYYPLSLVVSAIGDDDHIDRLLTNRLLKNRAEFSMNEKYGSVSYTPLLIASAIGDNYTVRRFIHNGAEVNYINKMGETALHFAVFNQDTSVLRTLIREWADLNIKDRDGNTALNKAIEHKRWSVAKILIQKGANLNIKDSKGNTALHKAIKHKRWSVVKWLIQNGADKSVLSEEDLRKLENRTEVHITKGPTPRQRFIEAVERADINSMKSLINEGGLNINTVVTNSSSKNALMYMANKNGDVEAGKLLIDSGINIDARDTIGRTALMFAAYKGHTNFVKLLLKSEADVHIEAKNGDTALTKAERENRTEIVQLLQEATAGNAQQGSSCRETFTN